MREEFLQIGYFKDRIFQRFRRRKIVSESIFLTEEKNHPNFPIKGCKALRLRVVKRLSQSEIAKWLNWFKNSYLG